MTLKGVDRLERAQVPELLGALRIVPDVESSFVPLAIRAAQWPTRGRLGASPVGIAALGAISVSAISVPVAILALLAAIVPIAIPFAIVSGQSVSVIATAAAAAVVVGSWDVGRIVIVPVCANVVRSWQSAAGWLVTSGILLIHGVLLGRVGCDRLERKTSECSTADLLRVDCIDRGFGRLGEMGGWSLMGVREAQTGESRFQETGIQEPAC